MLTCMGYVIDDVPAWFRRYVVIYGWKATRDYWSVWKTDYSLRDILISPCAYLLTADTASLLIVNEIRRLGEIGILGRAVTKHACVGSRGDLLVPKTTNGQPNGCFPGARSPMLAMA